MIYTGEYEHTIDAKQRLALPAELRSRMEKNGVERAFYAVPGPNGSIWLWPEDTFERMSDSLEQTLVPGEDLMAFDEVTFPLARHIDADSAGRLRLPASMLAEAGLGSTVMVLGMRDHIELRDPEQWARNRATKKEQHPQIMLRAREALLRQQRDGSGERRTSS